jgi:hypothetical protein
MSGTSKEQLAGWIELGLQFPGVTERTIADVFSSARKFEALELALIGKFGSVQRAREEYEQWCKRSIPVRVANIGPGFSCSVHTQAYLLDISYELAEAVFRIHAEGMTPAEKIANILRTGEIEEFVRTGN